MQKKRKLKVTQNGKYKTKEQLVRDMYKQLS